MARLEQRLRDYIHQVWDQKNFAKIDAFVGEDLEVTGLFSGEVVTAKDVQDLVEMFDSIMLQRTSTIVKAVEADDWISAVIETKGVSAYSQIENATRFQMMARFKGDKIVEYDIHCDFMTFFEDMGLLPSGSMGYCLSGQRLRPPA